MMKMLVMMVTLLLAPEVWAKSITVGSKNFTEQYILGEILAQLIEAKTDYEVHRRFNLGGTQIAFEALKSGEIDLYPEYTGTGLVSILKEAPKSDAQRVYSRIQKEFKRRYKLMWSRPYGFNNTYALAIKNDLDKNIENISDLKEYKDELRFGATHEFFNREDGYPGLKKHYGFALDEGNLYRLDPGLMYGAIENDQVDVISAFATDGRILAFDLKLREDDKEFFPPYFAATLLRMDLIEKDPRLLKIIQSLEGEITNKAMQRLNYLVDAENKSPAYVAGEFLVKSGLTESNQYKRLGKGSANIATYFWAHRDQLYRLLWEHMVLSLIALAAAVLVGIPLGVVLTRLPRISGTVFGIVSSIQTIPSIALLGFMIPLLGIGVTPAIVALFLYALLPLVRNAYTGIKDVPKNIVEASRGVGFTDRQILFKVELPLALSVIMAGVRTSTVIIVGTATLAGLIGAGGFGDPIFEGISSVNSTRILFGAIPATVLALGLDRILHLLEKMASPHTK